MYLEHVHKQREWTQIANAPHQKTTPMSADTKILHKLESTKGPTTEVESTTLEKEMRFSYCLVIGKLIYAYITF